MNLSIVIPLFNEADNVRGLYDGISTALEPTSRRFEIVFVDDGSDDGTLENLRALTDADPRVRAVRLRRNYGQTAAMCAGIEHARGEIIVTMDGDLVRLKRFAHFAVKGGQGWRPTGAADTGFGIDDNCCRIEQILFDQRDQRQQRAGGITARIAHQGSGLDVVVIHLRQSVDGLLQQVPGAVGLIVGFVAVRILEPEIRR